MIETFQGHGRMEGQKEMFLCRVRLCVFIERSLSTFNGKTEKIEKKIYLVVLVSKGRFSGLLLKRNSCSCKKECVIFCCYFIKFIMNDKMSIMNLPCQRFHEKKQICNLNHNINQKIS